jgi:hypothetical protein
MSSKIPKQLKKFDKKQAKMGMDVEKEHQDVTHGDAQMTAKIAASHLKEDPKYYTKLNKMEESVSNIDDQYLHAVNRGDMETVQKMVDMVAKSNGYANDYVYHATLNRFTQFNLNKKGVFFVTPSYVWAKKWIENNPDAKIKKLFIKSANLFDYTNNAHIKKLAIATSLGKIGIQAIKSGVWERLEDTATLQAIRSLKFDGLYVKEDGINNMALFYTNQIKSADPVTYDNESNIIPLSKRFNDKSDDIRESIATNFPKFESIYNQIMTEIKCWSGYKKQGTKIKNGKRVNNCVSINKNK